MKLVKQIVQIAYHRNGVGGLGFHAVLFDHDDKDVGRTLRMFAAVFKEPGAIAVVEVSSLASIGPEPGHRGVMFGIYPEGNSWRGDAFEPELRAEIAQYERIRASALREQARRP